MSTFIRLGLQRPCQYTGIDIQEARIRSASETFPGGNWIWGDAAQMMFASASFDLVLESTMLIQITDQELARRIAGEIIRVTKPGGFIVLRDWRYAPLGTREYSAVTSRRIRHLFQVPALCRIRGVFRGALVPPLGRLLSKRAPWLYFVCSGLFPVAVGEVTTVLQKIGTTRG